MASSVVTPEPPDEDEAGLLDLLALLLRRWRQVLGVALGATTVALVGAFLWPASYTAVTTFVPEVSSSQDLPAGLAGIAGQLGLSLGSGATTSPRFYADVLKSRGIMERMLVTRFADPDGKAPGDSITLLAYLDAGGDNRLDSLQEGRDALDDQVSVAVDAETNVLTLSITTSDRGLSAAVANRFLAYLDEFNSTTRQTKGRAQRAFVEGRLRESSDELKEAELRIKSFYETNRSWQQSPQLTFLEGQLRRRVDVVQEIYLTLNREYEKARIDEMNDTPGITVIDTAVAVQERSSPRPGLIAAMTFVLTGMAGLGWVLVSEYLERLRAQDPEGLARLMAQLPTLRRRT